MKAFVLKQTSNGTTAIKLFHDWKSANAGILEAARKWKGDGYRKCRDYKKEGEYRVMHCSRRNGDGTFMYLYLEISEYTIH